MNEAADDALSGLEAGLRRVATAERLLVATDFDGTLAALVDRPDAVMPDPGAVAALVSLAGLPDTRVAVISGRSRTVLEEHLGHAGFTLIGSHGAESDGIGPQSTDDVAPESARRASALRATLDELAMRLDDLALEYEGALVERKPTAVAFHYRQVPEEHQTKAADRATELGKLFDEVRVQPGHMVVELVVGDTNKGDAIDALRDRMGATATVFVGDDRTDEHAFARLQPGDLAVKVGSGVTCASVRVAAQSDVAPLFRRLLSLRAP